MTDELINDICEYIANNTGGEFTFGTGETNLKIGELVRGQSGVYAVSFLTDEPDRYTAVESYGINFFASNPNTGEAYRQLRIIYNLLHRMQNYSTTNFEIYFSNATGQIDDLDRDGAGSKILRVSVIFMCSRLALIS